MKNIFLIILSILFLSSSLSACPYSSMASIDEKIENTSISKDKLVKIIQLRQKGESELKLGNVQKSEETLNKALALLK